MVNVEAGILAIATGAGAAISAFEAVKGPDLGAWVVPFLFAVACAFFLRFAVKAG